MPLAVVKAADTPTFLVCNRIYEGPQDENPSPASNPRAGGEVWADEGADGRGRTH